MKYKKYELWWATFKTMLTLKPMYAQVNETDLDNVYTEHEESLSMAIYSIEI